MIPHTERSAASIIRALNSTSAISLLFVVAVSPHSTRHPSHLHSIVTLCARSHPLGTLNPSRKAVSKPSVLFHAPKALANYCQLPPLPPHRCVQGLAPSLERTHSVVPSELQSCIHTPPAMPLPPQFSTALATAPPTQEVAALWPVDRWRQYLLLLRSMLG